MGSNFLVLLGGAGIVQGFFVSVYILSTFLRKSLSNLLLLGLNFSILVFLINTVYMFIAGGAEVQLLSSISLSAIALIGPLFFFYVKAFSNKAYRFGAMELIQFAPIALPIVLGTGFCKLHLTYIGGYILIYLIASFIWLRKEDPSFQKKLWLYGLMIGLAGLAMLIAFFSIGMLCIISISIGFTAISYTITYLGIRFYNTVLIGAQETHRSGKPLPVDSKAVFKRFDNRIQTEKLFCDPEITLPTLAAMLGISAHKLSFMINTVTGEGFSDYINRYRIEESKKMLREGKDKVAAIAFDCGFNSLSTFYAVFKRQVGCSPAEFRTRSK